MGKDGAKVDTPTVSDAELKAAREALKSREEARHANNNMMYYLNNCGSKGNYDLMSASEQRDFFVKWFAKKLSDGTTKSSSSQQALLISETGNEHEWMGNERMISTLGEEGEEEKIGNMEGEEGEDSEEEKIGDMECKAMVQNIQGATGEEHNIGDMEGEDAAGEEQKIGDMEGEEGEEGEEVKIGNMEGEEGEDGERDRQHEFQYDYTKEDANEYAKLARWEAEAVRQGRGWVLGIRPTPSSSS
jgi:hypothetical protein